MLNINDLFKDSFIQTFDDTGGGRRELIRVFPMSEYGEKIEILCELNKAGAGVFFTPNPCKGGRAEKDITSIEWVYVDMDTGTKAEMQQKIKSAPIRPHMIIESKRSYHLYWKTRCNRDEFTNIIKGLIEFFDGDEAISSTNEVLRFPGFYHMKNPKNPFEVKIIYQSADLNAIIGEEMLKRYPHTLNPQTQARDTLESRIRGSGKYTNVKDIPIMDVLNSLGIVVKNGCIVLGGELTSARVNEKENYVNRFSGKEGSGSTIDVCMTYGNMSYGDSMDYLKKLGGITDEDIILAQKEEPDPIDDLSLPFTWGTDDIDRTFAPIQGDSFVVFAGESGAGKTAYTFDMAEKNAIMGHIVLYLSLEMSAEGILTRVSREYAGITKEQWRNKSTITTQEKELYTRRKAVLKKNKNLVTIGFGSGSLPTIQNIHGVIKRIQPNIVFIDNFDLIIKRGVQAQTEEESSLSGKILSLCKTEKVPIVLVHHLKKGEENSEAKMRGINALRGSGKIVHNADMVVMCWRQTACDIFDTPQQRARFIISQQKDRDFGGGGFHTCYFYKGSFYDKYPNAYDMARDVFYNDN